MNNTRVHCPWVVVQAGSFCVLPFQSLLIHVYLGSVSQFVYSLTDMNSKTFLGLSVVYYLVLFKLLDY